MIAKAGGRTVFVLSGVVSVVVSLTTVWIKSAMFWSDGKEIDEALVMKTVILTYQQRIPQKLIHTQMRIIAFLELPKYPSLSKIH